MKNIFLFLVMSALVACASTSPKQSGTTAINYNGEPGPVVKVAPMYPKAALSRGLQGTVSMSFVVGKDGKAKEVEVVESVGEPLEGAAVRALQKALYLPKYSGKSVAVVAEFALNK